MLQLGGYLGYHFVEHILMHLLAHSWLVIITMDFIFLRHMIMLIWILKVYHLVKI